MPIKSVQIETKSFCSNRSKFWTCSDTKICSENPVWASRNGQNLTATSCSHATTSLSLPEFQSAWVQVFVVCTQMPRSLKCRVLNSNSESTTSCQILSNKLQGQADRKDWVLTHHTAAVECTNVLYPVLTQLSIVDLLGQNTCVGIEAFTSTCTQHREKNNG